MFCRRILSHSTAWYVAAAALFVVSPPAHAGKYETIVADTRILYEACMQRCDRQDSLGALTRRGCLAGCAHMRREFPLNAKEYSRYGDCYEDYAKIAVNRDLYIAEEQEWCLEQTPHLHKRQGCKDAVDIFYRAATAENICGRATGVEQSGSTVLAPPVYVFASDPPPMTVSGYGSGQEGSGAKLAPAKGEAVAPVAPVAVDTPKYQKNTKKTASGKAVAKKGKKGKKTVKRPVAANAPVAKPGNPCAGQTADPCAERMRYTLTDLCSEHTQATLAALCAEQAKRTPSQAGTTLPLEEKDAPAPEAPQASGPLSPTASVQSPAVREPAVPEPAIPEPVAPQVPAPTVSRPAAPVTPPVAMPQSSAVPREPAAPIPLAPTPVTAPVTGISPSPAEPQAPQVAEPTSPAVAPSSSVVASPPTGSAPSGTASPSEASPGILPAIPSMLRQSDGPLPATIPGRQR